MLSYYSEIAGYIAVSIHEWFFQDDLAKSQICFHNFDAV